MPLQGIDVAVQQLGVQEATGNNDGIPAERYMHGDKLPWCAGLALYCNANSDDENVARTTKEHYEMRAVTGFIAAAKARGYFLDHTNTPARNDFVFFANTARDVGMTGSHMGIVENVDAQSATFTTIEGNLSNKVTRVTHKLSDEKIVGYGRPSLL